MSTKLQKKTTQVRINLESHRELKMRAAFEGRSMTSLIERALRDDFEKNKRNANYGSSSQQNSASGHVPSKEGYEPKSGGQSLQYGEIE